MTGDNNGRWAGDYAWPDDYDSYLSNARDALLLICAGNVAHKHSPPLPAGCTHIILELAALLFSSQCQAALFDLNPLYLSFYHGWAQRYMSDSIMLGIMRTDIIL